MGKCLLIFLIRLHIKHLKGETYLVSSSVFNAFVLEVSSVGDVEAVNAEA